MIHDCKNCPESGNCDLENPLKKARAIKESGGSKGLAQWVIEGYPQGPEEVFSRLQFSVMAIEADPDVLQSFRVQVYGWGGHEMPKHVQEALPQDVSGVIPCHDLDGDAGGPSTGRGDS